MTERRRTAGRRSEDSVAGAYAEAFIALTDGVVTTDAQGVVRTANPAAFRLLGEDVLVGTRFDELLYVSGATVIQSIEGHTVRRAWFPREERMGVLEIVSTAMRSPTPAIIHTIRDVTAQAELLRLKEDFLLQVAHELRTPVTSMSAALDLLHQDALSMPKPELSLMVNTLRRSAYRLEHLVENLLDAGSIEAGTFQVRAAPTSLEHALQESLVFVETLCVQKGQRIEVSLGPDTERIVADQRRTTQVFSNLITNASKYAPEGTTVRVLAAAHDGYVRVTVKDEGPGIPVEEQPLLFQRFFRSREVLEAAGGLGLGLTICRAIVRAQGGDIEIESAPGAGTSVHFTVPRGRDLAEEARER